MPHRQRHRARSPAQRKCSKKTINPSTQIHAATDALGNPVRFILTGGKCNETEGLLECFKANYVLVDNGYDGQTRYERYRGNRCRTGRASSKNNRTMEAFRPETLQRAQHY
jgi:transposase